MVFNEKAKASVRHLLSASKYVTSTLLTFSAIVFVTYGISSGQAALSGSPVLHFIVLCFGITLLAYLEGLQVAVLALEACDGNAWKDTHLQAYNLHKLATTGDNVQRFLVGRQFFVVFAVFFISQVTTFPSIGRPQAYPELLWMCTVRTALPGTLIVLAFGQLMPQLIAAHHAVLFCNFPGAMFVFRLTLCLEATGLTHFSWALTAFVMRLTGLHRKDKRGDLHGVKDDIEAAVPCSSSRHGALLDDLVQIQHTWTTDGLSDYLQQLSYVLGTTESSRRLDSERLPLSPNRAEIDDGSSNEDQPIPPASEHASPLSAGMVLAGMKASGMKTVASAQSYEKSVQADIYPSPQVIAAYLAASGEEVPCFLLPSGHEQHMPPHLVAFGLMAGLSHQIASREA